MDESHELPPGFIERLIQAVKQKKQNEEQANKSFKEDEQEENIESRSKQFPPKQQIYNYGEQKQIFDSQNQLLQRDQLLKKSIALLSNPIFRFKKQAQAPQSTSARKFIQERKKTQKDIFSKEMAKLQQKRRQVQEAAKRQNQKNLIFQRELKLYFQNHLTRILNKLQENTEDKFKEIHKKLDKLESYCEFKNKRQDFQHRQPPPRRKKIYIRNGQKLNYINKIERKELTPRQAAALLNTTEKNVQGWMSRKDSLLQKEHSRRQKDANGTIDYDNLGQIMF